MTAEKCTCGMEKSGEVSTVREDRKLPGYWCEVCQRTVAEKRCPLCGLKARKIHREGAGNPERGKP